MMESGIQRTLDRLVDGELGDAEQADILRRLDGEPDGWRRLALAFVEAQRWGREFRALTSETVPASAPPRPVPRAVTPSSRRARILWPVVAASVLAFGAGWLAGAGRPAAPGRPHGDQIARPEPTAREDTPDEEVAGGTPAPDDERETVVVTFDDPKSDGVREVEVPVFDAEEVAAAWLQGAPTAVPEPVLEALRRSGHEVLQRRTYYPVGRDGDQRLLVPVDEVKVQYAARPVY